MRLQPRVPIALVVGFALGFGALASIFLIPRMGSGEPPEDIARAYYWETYTRDFSNAWGRLSINDQFVLSREDYLASNSRPNEPQSALLQQLAQWGSFETVAIVSTESSRAVVSARVRYPDLEQAEIEELLDRAAESDIDQDLLLEHLLKLRDSNQLQFIDEVVNFEMVSEGNQWRIDQKLGHRVTVHLKAAVSDDLPWDFHPILDEISALPGQMVSVAYLARNNSETSITAKAVHEVDPVEAARFFETIECFCFTEQTLAPGEEREMVLLFSINPLLPRDSTEIENLYTFYTLESFPSGG